MESSAHCLSSVIGYMGSGALPQAPAEVMGKGFAGLGEIKAIQGVFQGLHAGIDQRKRLILRV